MFKTWLLLPAVRIHSYHGKRTACYYLQVGCRDVELVVFRGGWAVWFNDHGAGRSRQIFHTRSPEFGK